MHCGDDKQYYDGSGTIGIDDGGQAEQKYQQAGLEDWWSLEDITEQKILRHDHNY